MWLKASHKKLTNQCTILDTLHNSLVGLSWCSYNITHVRGLKPYRAWTYDLVWVINNLSLQRRFLASSWLGSDGSWIGSADSCTLIFKLIQEFKDRSMHDKLIFPHKIYVKQKYPKCRLKLVRQILDNLLLYHPIIIQPNLRTSVNKWEIIFKKLWIWWNLQSISIMKYTHTHLNDRAAGL